MLQTRVAKEVTIRLENEIGALDAISRALPSEASTSSHLRLGRGAQAVIGILTDDSVRHPSALNIALDADFQVTGCLNHNGRP